jgi:hypothetical protein
MNEKEQVQEQQPLQSIPNPLREQLQRAQLLLNQSEYADAHGRPDVAYMKAQQATSVMSNLVARLPEGVTLSMLADQGCQGYEFRTIEQTDGYVVLERRFCGLSFGQHVMPTRITVRRDSRGRVF